MDFTKDITAVGNALGLKGQFLVDFGFLQILQAINSKNDSNARAIEMLEVAAKYIDTFCQEGQIFYDGAMCDGYCVADDCLIAANELREEAERGK